MVDKEHATGYSIKPTRLRVVGYDIVTAQNMLLEEEEAQNYVLLSLPEDSVYFDWKYKHEKAFASLIRVERTQSRTMIDMTLSVEQAGRTREFILSIPYGWFQSAHMFSLHQDDACLFLVKSKAEIYEPGTVQDFNLFDFYVEAIESENGMTERLINVFQEVVADRAIYNLTPKEYDTIRGDTLSLVLQLARGEQAAFARVMEFARRYDAVRKKVKDKDYEPTLEEKQMLFTRLHVSRLLEFGHPAQYAARGGTLEQVAAERETITEFEQIMQHNNLTATFNELLDSYEKPVGPEATDDQKMTYFASSTAHLPVAMASLTQTVTTLRSFERNWNSDASDVDVDEQIPDGDALATGFVIIALRLARSQELIADPEEEFHPSYLLQTALSMEDEPSFWMYQQAHRLIGAGDSFPFEDFLLSQLPNELPMGVPQEALVGTAVGNAFHNLGHLILRDEVGRPALRHAFEKLPIISSFLEDIYEQQARLDEQQEPSPEENACASVVATVNTLQLDFDRKEMVGQLGAAYLAIAELNALRQTEYSQGSREWHEWLQEYLYGISD